MEYEYEDKVSLHFHAKPKVHLNNKSDTAKYILIALINPTSKLLSKLSKILDVYSRFDQAKRFLLLNSLNEI
jgi:hypothetical protein